MKKLFENIFKKETSIQPKTILPSSEFKKLVTKQLAPFFREHGFKGSGFHFKRLNPNNQIIDIIGIQVNKYGGEFWLEIGVHPISLPESWPSQYDLKKITHAHLDIRERLKFNSNSSLPITSLETALQSIQLVKSSFQNYALNYFNTFNSFPSPFDKVRIVNNKLELPKELEDKMEDMTDIRKAWLCANVLASINSKNQAKGIASFALELIKPSKGSSLTDSLQKIKNAV